MSKWCNSVGKDYGVGTDMLTTVSKSEGKQDFASSANSTTHIANQATPVWKTSEFWNNVGVGMAGVLTTAAIIVAAVAFTVGTAGVGPLLLGILGVGTITVGAVAVNDVNRNKVSSTNTYLETGLFSSLVGATIGYIAGGPIVSSAVAPAGAIAQGASYGASEGGSDALQTMSRQSVDDKLTRYLLNADYPVGGSKAKWFKEALGYTQSNMDDLAKQIVFDPTKAVQTGVTEYGTKFNQSISITGANGKVIEVTFAWMKSAEDDVVRLVTSIPTKK